MTKQIPFKLPHDASFAAEDYIISSSNKSAHDMLMSWPNWSAHALMLIGPRASGKSHLASIWAEKAGALRIDGALLEEGDVEHVCSNVIFEIEAHDMFDQRVLFHLYNWAKEQGLSLLISSDTPVDEWSFEFPDLKSRLLSLPVAYIDHPDDQLITILLQKLFSDRQQTISPTVINYLLPRIERSFEATSNIVEQIDHMALAKKSKITVPLVRSCLEA
jgi:chromosomal replication initiation ATPase DnaA